MVPLAVLQVVALLCTTPALSSPLKCQQEYIKCYQKEKDKKVLPDEILTKCILEKE